MLKTGSGPEINLTSASLAQLLYDQKVRELQNLVDLVRTHHGILGLGGRTVFDPRDTRVGQTVVVKVPKRYRSEGD